ncbi:U11/U12 small nuclear ribonucleoprotein 25 kDa protein [Larimichthys crocea]|uniref:Uncharacterized protein n=1 Tax=Larimichthys crocea TaxID=215358 RepID=A0ACD3R616_LARCR|nr:U11/U12 small nuclear ribonucleoprotein 25 kDa protein [Larimichthys crocea]
MMEEQSQDTVGGAGGAGGGAGESVKDEEVEKENLTEMAAAGADEEDEEALPHSEILDIFEEGLARLVQDPLLCDLPIQVTLEEVNSQIALEYGQAMTVRVLKADGEIMPSTMSSSDSELKRITTELNNLSLKRQQLLERKKIQCIIQELRGRIEFGQPEEAPTQDEIDSNDEKLKELNERISELQKSHKNLLSGNDCKKEAVWLVVA